jgi:hypothetical protein
MTSDPTYGIDYLVRLLRPYGLDKNWCYLSEDGNAHGMSRHRLAQECRNCDIYFNLSNINWIPELEQCRCRVLVDTDPVFTQIGAHGLGGPFARYQALYTFGENVHKPGCLMPTGGGNWLSTRQPVVLDLWDWEPGDRSAPFTTVMNWAPLGNRYSGWQDYGQKDREFEPFFNLPNITGERMELTAKTEESVKIRLTKGGWRLSDSLRVTRDPHVYQQYIKGSKAEFSVAKHGYVVTRCGWFSERSAAYLASSRPVLIQDTGFPDWLETGIGVIAFNSVEEAIAGIEEINSRYEFHCRTAREIAEVYFDSKIVLTRLIESALNPSARQSADQIQLSKNE